MKPDFPPFPGRVRRSDGTLRLVDRPGFDRALMAFAGKPVELVLRAPRRKRSNLQNRWYFGCVLALLAEECGVDYDTREEREAFHDAVAFKFLALPNCPVTGSPRRLRTPQTTTAAFGHYVERVRRWAAEDFSLDIPDPKRWSVPEEAWRGEVAA